MAVFKPWQCMFLIYIDIYFHVWCSGVNILGLTRLRMLTMLRLNTFIQWRTYSKLDSEQAITYTANVSWNTFPYCLPHRIPVQTIFEAHPSGCAAIAMSPDAKYIATISSTLPQVRVEFLSLVIKWSSANFPFILNAYVRQIGNEKKGIWPLGRCYNIQCFWWSLIDILVIVKYRYIGVLEVRIKHISIYTLKCVHLTVGRPYNKSSANKLMTSVAFTILPDCVSVGLDHQWRHTNVFCCIGWQLWKTGKGWKKWI